jgi:hypothetical protein
MANDLIQIGVDVRTNIKQATADLDKMGGSVVNNINTINRLESEVKQLNRELTRGRVSEAAYAKGMQQINNELGIFQQRAAKAADVERKFGQAAAGGGKSLNRFNMTLQQGGYQLQDFIVQIQSGTSFFTAFSQQGSQFASIFGPKGAVIGAVIAIGSAIAAIAVGSLTAKDALKELQDQVDSIKDSFKNYADAASMAAMSNDEIAEKFGVANDRIRSTLQLLEDLERKVAQQNLSELMSEMADMFSVGGAGYKGAAVGKFFDINAFFSIKAETRKNNRAAISDFQQAQREIAEAQTDTERAEGLSRLLNAAQNLAELSDGINEKEKEFIQNIAQALLVQEQLVNAKTSQQQTTERVAREEYESYQRNIDQRFKGEQAVFDQSVSFSKASQKLIDDNAESRKREINQRFKGEQQVFSQAVTISKATQALIDKNAEARQREINHRFKGEQEVFNQAVEISDELLEVIEDKAEAYAEAVKRKFEDQDFFFRVRFADETELMQQSLTPAKQKGPEKVRKQVLTDIQDTIDALREQTKHETKLLSLTGERLKEEEIYYDLVLKNKDADIKLSDKKLRAIAKEIAAQQEANEMYEEAIQFVDGISDAFSDFVATGLRDFKSFVSSIKDMFVRLLADMAAAAVRNRILIPITTGFMASAGNAAAGTAMGSFGSGTLASTLATGAKAFGTGFGSVFGAGGIGLGGSFQALGSLGSSIGSGTFMSTLGAAAPALLAVVAVVGLLTKKTKLLDSGLRATVEGFDVAIETFQLTQTSRLFGLLKGSKKTTYEAASAEVADPLIEAIGDMQQSIVDAAGTLGIGADAFDNFSYQFKLSLKGLTEEEQLQKINEEITKMGDSFASLTGHFETMNQLLAVAQQRYDLETRLLQLTGNETELLIRQREREGAATHELNKDILAQIQAVEDAQISANKAQMLANEAVAQAEATFATVQRSIQARKEVITRSFNEIMETIQNRIEAANENVSVSQGILGSLEGASSARIGMSRGAGLSYLRELRGASRITDEKMLDEALQAVADPSEGLYKNFTDYQRDFADQSNLIRELEEKARYQLSTDEATLLAIQNEAEAAQSRYDEQIANLDDQLEAAQNQINTLRGIDTSVMSVEDAVSKLDVTISQAMAAQTQAISAALAAAAAASSAQQFINNSGGVGSSGTSGTQQNEQSFADKYGTGGTYKGYDLAELRGSGDLKSAAGMLGIGTSGKSGAQIQQEIANASGLAVNLDNATRNQKFAMGGMFGGGVRMVGERGPELEATGPSRIFSTKQTAELFRNPELVEEVRSLRAEVAGLRSESRQLQASNSKYVKRNYDINRKWDTEGLPATRT